MSNIIDFGLSGRCCKPAQSGCDKEIHSKNDKDILEISDFMSQYSEECVGEMGIFRCTEIAYLSGFTIYVITSSVWIGDIEKEDVTSLLEFGNFIYAFPGLDATKLCGESIESVVDRLKQGFLIKGG